MPAKETKSKFVTLISLWLAAPEHLQQEVLDEARRLAKTNEAMKDLREIAKAAGRARDA